MPSLREFFAPVHFGITVAFLVSGRVAARVPNGCMRRLSVAGQDDLMHKSLASAAIAVVAVLALQYFALSGSIGPVVRAQTSLNCPVGFDSLQLGLKDADEEDSTGLNH